MTANNFSCSTPLKCPLLKPNPMESKANKISPETFSKNIQILIPTQIIWKPILMMVIIMVQMEKITLVLAKIMSLMLPTNYSIKAKNLWTCFRI